MGDDDPNKWKRRPHTRIYNYNYNVSEGYYKPQTEYMETKHCTSRSTKSPPLHQSYAERFAKRPWYGGTSGLPYNDQQSAGPLIKLADRQWRSSSLLREMKQLEEEGVPLGLRASRRRKKFEEEEERLGLRQRENRKVSLDAKIDARANDFHNQIKRKIKSLDDQLTKSSRTASTLDNPSKWNYNLDLPSGRVKHKEENYTSPYTGASVKSVSHSDYSHSFSKPPLIPSRSPRFSSDNSDPQPRRRFSSGGNFSDLPRSSRRSVEPDEEIATYSNRAPKIREARRLRESQDFTDGISNKIDMMRSQNIGIDPLAFFSPGFGRSSRSSSVDRTTGRRGSAPRYVYGIGKI